ncbi:hypothetical protein ACFOLJ_25375 [Rugamonas sp. CCM 8940]|uniref:hypothetical protein n=1 Tax=Rugamonas sp. CCM 8940 TaxID=2765359 RepID=UPI0018F76BDF|nr:hypothetical protein [Rugamonas sp. CCM 8940]MBJ7310894.1 hypothetical protein [Rugamonas sp. CCM 8940]
MPKGADAEREREYRELQSKFKEEGRYPGREEEVAARIVNKQRAEYGETQGGHALEQGGATADHDLPIARYDHLTVEEVGTRLDRLSRSDLRALRRYETAHKRRQGVVELLDARLNARPV